MKIITNKTYQYLLNKIADLKLQVIYVANRNYDLWYGTPEDYARIYEDYAVARRSGQTEVEAMELVRARIKELKEVE